MDMSIQKKLKLALTYAGMFESELAIKIGTTPQAFNNRMQRGCKFTSEELERIAETLGAEFVAYFEFPNGTKL